MATAGDGLFPNRHPVICQGLIHVIALLPYEPEPKVVSVRFTNYCDCDLFSLQKRIMTPWRLLGVSGSLSRTSLRAIPRCLADEEKKHADESGLFGWYTPSISKYHFSWSVDNCGVGSPWQQSFSWILVHVHTSSNYAVGWDPKSWLFSEPVHIL